MRNRLVLASGGSILVAVALFAGATIALVTHQLRSSLDGALRTRAQSVAQLAISAPAVLTETGALESPVSGRQIAVEVVNARGAIIARSLTLGARLLPQDTLARSARLRGTTGFEEIAIGGRRFRVFVAPIAQAGGPAAGGVVLVASDLTDIRQTVRHLGVVLALSGAGVAVLAALLAGALTRRGLQPLSRLAHGAEEIERTGDPARRLPPSETAGAGRRHLETPTEIAQLTGVLNRMLDSLERSRASERRFLADASHELRTPVTSLLGNVEYAAKHGADPEVLDDLGRDAARLARLVDDLLVLERQADTTPQSDLVAVDELVQAVAAAHERVDVSQAEPLQVRGEKDALRRAIENLVDNALVHGPPGGRVQLSVHASDSLVLVDVRDDGAGPDPATRERLFERFWRAPEAAGRPGSGLGLSIVAAIAERHGGNVHVAGSTFTIELPISRP